MWGGGGGGDCRLSKTEDLNVPCSTILVSLVGTWDTWDSYGTLDTYDTWDTWAKQEDLSAQLPDNGPGPGVRC